MTISASGLFVQTWRDVVDATQLAVDLDAETHKVALFKNAVTPNFSQASPVPAYGVAPFNANECSGAGYTAGGATLTGTVVTEVPTGHLTWDASDPQWPASTITDAKGALIYADALAGNNALMLINFGALYSTVAGLFRIFVAAGGLYAWKLVPS